MSDEEEGQPLDIENVMAEIKVAAPEFLPFLAWCGERVEAGEVTENELMQTLELVYSYSRGKNEDLEAAIYDRG